MKIVDQPVSLAARNYHSSQKSFEKNHKNCKIREVLSPIEIILLNSCHFKSAPGVFQKGFNGVFNLIFSQ